MSGYDASARCLLCEHVLPRDAAKRCLTDCAHEFCLACICRELAENKNRCPACHAHVKKVHQLADTTTTTTTLHGDSRANAAPAPASIKFCNATYVLNVSIWSVDDPARELASLFHLYGLWLERIGNPACAMIEVIPCMCCRCPAGNMRD